jgi:hypothetical protein
MEDTTPCLTHRRELGSFSCCVHYQGTATLQVTEGAELSPSQELRYFLDHLNLEDVLGKIHIVHLHLSLLTREPLGC